MNVFFHRIFFCLAVALMLAACGSGDSRRGLEEELSDRSTEPEGSSVASISLFSDQATLRSSGQDVANITAIVKDSDNIVLSGVAVEFTADSGAFSVLQPVTDALGEATARVGSPNDPTNRTITITAKVGDIEASMTIDVTGSTLSVSGPASVVINDGNPITINLRDSDNNAIASQTVNLSSALNNTFSDATPVTDSTGSATVTYFGSNSGSDTIRATALSGSVAAAHTMEVSPDIFRLTQTTPGDIALNADSEITLTWLNPDPVVGEDVEIALTRGTIDDTGSNVVTVTTDDDGEAVFEISADNAGPSVITATSSSATGLTSQLEVDFVATQADAISVSASPTSVGTGGEKSSINAVVRDPNGNLVKGLTVGFSVDDVTGGSIFPPTAVTDSNGIASTVYTSSNSSSAQNGVSVTATVKDTAISDVVQLSVVESPVFITIGTGNTIEEPDETTYAKEFAISVTDVSGAAIANQEVSISVTPLLPAEGTGIAYFKGFREWSDDSNSWVTVITANCQNEDLDLNGVLDLDVDNDLNNNGLLEPGNHVISSSKSVVTDESGWATVSLRYAQQFALYLNVMIRVTADVSGTESIEEQVWRTAGLSDDFNDEQNSPPGIVSPFGTSGSCANTQ